MVASPLLEISIISLSRTACDFIFLQMLFVLPRTWLDTIASDTGLSLAIFSCATIIFSCATYVLANCRLSSPLPQFHNEPVTLFNTFPFSVFSPLSLLPLHNKFRMASIAHHASRFHSSQVCWTCCYLTCPFHWFHYMTNLEQPYRGTWSDRLMFSTVLHG